MSVTGITYSIKEYKAVIRLGSYILAYEIVSKLVDRLIQEQFESFKPYLKLAALSATVTFISPSDPLVTFSVLCMGYIGTQTFLFIIKKRKNKNVLPSYMRDMTQDAKKAGKCFYTGYENYIHHLEIIMGRRGKNNAILAGDPGIGKSAITETVAWMSAHGKLSPNSPLANKRFIEISVTSFVGNTMFRGQLEEKVQEMLEVAAEDPSVVYVVDEIHQLIGAGASQGHEQGGVSNQLKPALARPGLKIIGATTLQEYEKYFLKDPALARRFTKVDVFEPGMKECFEMMKKSAEMGYYNTDRYQFKISGQALRTAIFFSRRDNPERRLPDVANDLIDMTCSVARFRSSPKQATTEPTKATQTKPAPIVLDIVVEHILEQHATTVKKWDITQLRAQYMALMKFLEKFHIPVPPQVQTTQV